MQSRRKCLIDMDLNAIFGGLGAKKQSHFTPLGSVIGANGVSGRCLFLRPLICAEVDCGAGV
jgi:hypothetical protein